MPKIPVSTYRVQFNKHFRFVDAGAVIQYLYALGISDLYASPYLKAKEGSLHGYDIVDPASLNPEVGTEEEYQSFISELHKYKMGQILDIVPNHMCIESRDNLWWMDVLENGPSSAHAKFFDIDWDPQKKELKEMVLLPVLGNQYGDVLENQELRLAFERGGFYIYYYDNKFPVRPKTYIFILKHRMDILQKELTPNDPGLVELLSIVTSLEHLPDYSETAPEKIAERYREKETAKKRIWNLYKKSTVIKSFIHDNIEQFNGKKGEPESLDLLDFLLRTQAYRLAYWRVAAEEINYRRFFDINSLAAIRMEDPAVFEATHRLILKLIAEGHVTGLRVDHPDGLYNPAEYFRTLQRNCYLKIRLNYSEHMKKEYALPYKKREIKQEIAGQFDEMSAADPNCKPFYIVGEKILIKDERMPEDWPIFSTTGYVFLNIVNGIFIQTNNARSFNDTYEKFIRSKMNFQDIVYEKKKLIMQVAMSSEINMLGHYLNELSENDRHTRDFTLNSLTAAIIEIIAFSPVYRTYINQSGVSEIDRRYIEFAVSKAKRKNPAINRSIFDFLKDILLLNYPEKFSENEKREWLNFVMRLQQLTGPVMAKGLEDTVFYVYNRFISLNDVGGSPERFGTSLETFHGKNIERMKCWPHALITTATHDSKRGEDVRARINVLSEMPDEWRKRVIPWKRMNKKRKAVIDGRHVPDLNEEYLLYQTLIGTWPVGIMEESDRKQFKDRIKQYMVKASREAKLNTSWINPDSIYEDALMIFIESIMNDTSDNQFLEDFMLFQQRISGYGMFNSLSQTLLKITSPGVPDFYQGTELWDFSLVDPDNRRIVDYSVRMTVLEEIKQRESKIPLHEFCKELMTQKENGMVKLFLIYKALNYRKANRKLFELGEYLPLEAMGKCADNVCAFARRMGNNRTIVIVPRFFTQLVPEPHMPPLGKTVWKDSSVIVPIAEPGAKYRNIFTGEMLNARDYRDATALNLSEVFAHFPVAMLERIYPEQ